MLKSQVVHGIFHGIPVESILKHTGTGIFASNKRPWVSLCQFQAP